MFLGGDVLYDDGACLLEGVTSPLLPGDLEGEGDDDAFEGGDALTPHLPVDVAIILSLYRLALVVE